MSNVICTDDRFEVIAKYKAELLDKTNIETSAEEMAVIDNILFRMWQMGWLDRLEQPTVDAVPVVRCKDCKWFKSGIDIDGKPFTKCIGANESVRTYGHTAPDWFCADGERRTDDLDRQD